MDSDTERLKLLSVNMEVVRSVPGTDVDALARRTLAMLDAHERAKWAHSGLRKRLARIASATYCMEPTEAFDESFFEKQWFSTNKKHWLRTIDAILAALPHAPTPARTTEEMVAAGRAGQAQDVPNIEAHPPVHLGPPSHWTWNGFQFSTFETAKDAQQRQVVSNVINAALAAAPREQAQASGEVDVYLSPGDVDRLKRGEPVSILGWRDLPTVRLTSKASSQSNADFMQRVQELWKAARRGLGVLQNASDLIFESTSKYADYGGKRFGEIAIRELQATVEDLRPDIDRMRTGETNSDADRQSDIAGLDTCGPERAGVGSGQLLESTSAQPSITELAERAAERFEKLHGWVGGEK